jgi:hypothetical protein
VKKSLKLIILTFLVRIPIIGKHFAQDLFKEKRLYERFALKKLSNIIFKLSGSGFTEKIFYLKDISMGGLSFYHDANDQEKMFKAGSMLNLSLEFDQHKVEAKFKIAWSRNSLTGCMVQTNRQEYKKFVVEKMSDILVKDENLMG